MPDSRPVSAGTTARFRPAAFGPCARAAARRPIAAVKPVATTMASSEGNRKATAEVPTAPATKCMTR